MPYVQLQFRHSLSGLRAALGGLGVLPATSSAARPEWYFDLERVLLVAAAIGYSLESTEQQRFAEWLGVCSPVIARNRLAALTLRLSDGGGDLRDLLLMAERFGALRDVHNVVASQLGWSKPARPRASRLYDARGRSRPSAFEPSTALAGANPCLRSQLLERAVRRGDLRASIVVSLELDFAMPPTQAELAEHLQVTKAALRYSLAALMLEQRVAIDPDPDNKRKVRVRLLPAPSYTIEGGESCPEDEAR